jgi:soluble lytic murein transglycosylase-like protein
MLIASLTALVLIVHERFAQHARAVVPAYELAVGEPKPPAGHNAASSPVVAVPEERLHRAIAEFVGKRYRVSQDVTFDLVSTAYAAGRQFGLDPLLIIAVIAVESGFNPIAESVAGAKGLMQVIPRYHGDKLQEFGGADVIYDPQINILVGSQILKEYFGRTGNMTTALQMYNGALQDEQERYTSRVMTEKRRLKDVVRQFNRANAFRTASAEDMVRGASSLVR